jgi:sugar lactone lactonase YvrE
MVSPSGQVVREIALTGRFSTNLTVGGADGRRAFVTMHERGLVASFRVAHPGSDWQRPRARRHR